MTKDTGAAARPAIGKVRSDADHADLLTYHLTVLNTAAAAVEVAKGPVAEAKAVLAEKQEDQTKAFNAAKADLGRGYSREYLQSLMLDSRSKITALVDREVQRARDKIALSQPVWGVQPELFPGKETPTAARDEMAWTAEGFQRGLRGDMREIQDGDPPAFHQAIIGGFRAGQTMTQERVARAMELRHAAEQPDASAPPKDLNGGAEPEAGTPAAKKAERKSIAAAKDSLEKMDAKGAGKAASEPATAGVH